LFQLLGAFHWKKPRKRNKQVGCALGFDRSTSRSPQSRKSTWRGASRGFASYVRIVFGNQTCRCRIFTRKCHRVGRIVIVKKKEKKKRSRSTKTPGRHRGDALGFPSPRRHPSCRPRRRSPATRRLPASCCPAASSPPPPAAQQLPSEDAAGLHLPPLTSSAPGRSRPSPPRLDLLRSAAQ
jgi:hypothetical protein